MVWAAIFFLGNRWPGLNQVAALADGRHILSAGNDKTLLLWDVATGDAIQRFSGHSISVSSVELTPDGRLALSGAVEDPMILWDVVTGQAIRRFPLHHAEALDFAPKIAIHPSGLTALTDQSDGSLLKWQLAEPTPAELIDWLADNRTLRDLTCLERETFQIEPLCEDGVPPTQSADMVAAARLAVASIATDPDDSTVPLFENTSLDLAPPDRTPQVAVLGDNRGELERGNFDVWMYEGHAGEILSMKMIADKPLTDPTIPLESRYETGLLDTRLYVINPDGTILQRIDDEITPDLRQLPDAHFEAVKLPVDGQYRIEARSSLDDLAGGYTLHIEQRNPIWNLELFSDYTGHYIEGPWRYDTFIYFDGDRLMQSFDYSGIFGFENIAISDTDFISETDSSLTVFTRDENGQVNGYKILVALMHPVARQWYYAERVGDLPPDFYENLAVLQADPSE